MRASKYAHDCSFYVFSLHTQLWNLKSKNLVKTFDVKEDVNFGKQVFISHAQPHVHSLAHDACWHYLSHIRQLYLNTHSHLYLSLSPSHLSWSGCHAWGRTNIHGKQVALIRPAEAKSSAHMGHARKCVLVFGCWKQTRRVSYRVFCSVYVHTVVYLRTFPLRVIFLVCLLFLLLFEPRAKKRALVYLHLYALL